jgi:signal transduction histidine kinase/CheY-like chemotaxis protein
MARKPALRPGSAPAASRGAAFLRGNAARADLLLRRLVAGDPRPLLILSEQGQILQANPPAARLFAVDHGLLINSAFALFCAEVANQSQLDAVLRGAIARVEFSLRRGDGEVFPARLDSARLPMVRSLAVWIDNLDEAAEDSRHWQKLQEETERNAAAKTMFLATMSHEIRTPMNGMIGMLELLEQSALTADQREMVEVIQESGRTLLSITDEILDLSKIEAGKLTLDQISFGLRQSIEDIIELVASKARKKRLELAWWCDSALPDRFFGDPVRFKQIGLNLLSNAVKFTDQGSVILRLHSLGGPDERPLVRFEVTDTGMGLSPEQQQRLFQPFEQVNEGNMRHLGGTGLGLSICHRLTALMGGDIGVVSAVGAGSTFWVEIPLAVDGSPLTSSQDLAGLTALVMDDLPEARATLASQLRSEGALVLEASDALAAAELIEDAVKLDFAIVDVPDGLTLLLDQLRQRLPGEAIIATLPSADDAALTWCQEASLAPPLLKPLRKKQLLRAVAVALGRHEPTVAPVAIATAEGPAAGGPLILVAEDNAINRLVLGKQLRQLGFACDMAEHGEAAWAMLQEKHYDLLLSDCIMPVLDGYELARRIRRSEARKGSGHLRIIALTANVLDGEEAKCRRAGMDFYVTKPLTLDRLAAMLRKEFPAEAKGDIKATMLAKAAADGTEPIDWTALSAILGSDDPADLREIANFFVESFAVLLDDLDQALQRGDDEELVRAAHSAKGAARNGAAPRLAEIMSRLEQAGREGAEDKPLYEGLAAARSEFARLCDWLKTG